MSFFCCLLSVVAIVAVNTVVQYMPLIFLMESEKSVGDIDFIIRLQNNSNPYIDFNVMNDLMLVPALYQKEGSVKALENLSLSPRQEYVGWLYPRGSSSCSEVPVASRTVFSCDMSGVFTSIYVINDTREMDIGWGRGYNVLGEEDPTGLIPPNTVIVSETVASALNVKDGDSVIIQMQLESSFALIIQPSSCGEVECSEDTLRSWRQQVIDSPYSTISRTIHIISSTHVLIDDSIN